MSIDKLLRRSSADGSVAITPEDAEWSRVSFRVEQLVRGGALSAETADEEVGIVVLSGTATVETAVASWTLGERTSVFDGPAHVLYLPPGTGYRVSGAGAEVAICGARCESRLAPREISPADYSIETRGSGSSSRRVATLIGPDFPADRLLLVEVWTPGGNWSSYPPHKHDEARPPEEIRLEEIYYFRLKKPNGFALQRLYSEQRGIDQAWTVTDRTVLTIPWGYHTTAAAPGYDLYYLNVLAGDAHDLTAFDDPDHSWIRRSWSETS